MEQDVRDEPRPANDSRKRTPVESGKVNTVKTVESKPSLGQRWRECPTDKDDSLLGLSGQYYPDDGCRLHLGRLGDRRWTAQKAAETMAKDAVVERLAPICVAQFNQDPDKALKLDEMNGLTSYQRAQYVQDQGWATISGEEKPDRKVADACTKLLLEMSP